MKYGSITLINKKKDFANKTAFKIYNSLNGKSAAGVNQLADNTSNDISESFLPSFVTLINKNDFLQKFFNYMISSSPTVNFD